MATVGIIGAGLMGGACAKRLAGAGFDVLAYDVDAAKRAALEQPKVRAAATLAELAAACAALVVAVFNTEQVEEVVEGGQGLIQVAAGKAPPPAICVSTCDPDRLAALIARAAGHGARILEVPISGTSRQVAQGSGVGLVAGSRALMEELAPVLDAICPRRYFLGDAGNASRAKLAVNLILGLNRAALAEGLVFAERLGLDREAFLDVARGSAAYSQVMDVKGALMARREFRDPQSRVDQSLKDFALMLEQARARSQGLPFAETYVRMLEDCVEHGEGGWDNAAIADAIARRRS